MKTHGWIATGIVTLLLPLSSRAQDEVEVRGRVIDADGKPVARAGVATMWTQVAGKAIPYRGATTDAEGRFTLSLMVGGHKIGLMARDKDDRAGGLVLLGDKPPDQPMEIKLVPLVSVKGRFFCKELNKPPRGSFNIFTGSTYVFRGGAPDGVFSFRHPPGTYRLWTSAHGYQRIEKHFTLESGKPDVDFGDMDVPPSILTRHVGKALPAWHITDARGVKKTVQLSDYKGKWVLLDFWGYWCGPCVVQTMPYLIDLYETHEKDRDKFEVLAFHDTRVRDFTELDGKLGRTRERYWRGQNLPFPILLDSTGQTIKDFGIEHLPTMLLIDPEGKLVGEVREKELEAKLPPLPMSLRIARALDRNLPTFDLRNKRTLDMHVHFMSYLSNLPIRLDLDSLKKAAISPDAPLLLEMTTSITLRSALNLILEAFPLTYTADDDGLVIRARQPSTPPKRLSERQIAVIKRIEKALDRKVSFAFKDKPLAEVARFFANRIDHETIVLSPRDRMDGRLDLKTSVTGSAKDVTVREALKMLLEPIGVTYTIRDEVIVLTAKSKTPSDK